mgnify:CR=1 FL=1
MPLAIQGIDEAVLLWIQEAVRQAWLDPVVKAFTTLGNAGILWIVLSVAMLFWRPTRKAGLLAGCALIFSLLFTNLGLKLIFTRPRPYTVVEGLIPLLTSGDPNSFPSGHTCAAFSAGLVWARTLPKTLDAPHGGDPGGADGALPAVCGSALPQRCAGRRPGGYRVRYAGPVYRPALAETTGA